MDKTSILIVEDEFLVAEDIRMYLEDSGYNVVGSVGRADQAVQMTRNLRPSVVLMDVKLEDDGDGISAARRILESTGIPVIFLTAYADRSTLERAKQVRPAGYLTKPVKAEALYSTIEIALYNNAVKRHGEDRDDQWSLFRFLFSESMSPVLIVDEHNRTVVDANEIFLEETGFERAKLLGKSTLTLADWNSREHVNALLALFEQTEAEQEVNVRTVTGELRAFRCAARQLTLGKQRFRLLQFLESAT